MAEQPLDAKMAALAVDEKKPKGKAPAPAAVPAPELTPEEKAALDAKIALLRSVGEECVGELPNLLTKKPNFRLYDGFEPSGRMHIAQGVFKAMNVNKCTEAGGTFVFWVADWFALMNDKMGGDIDKIKVVGQYLIEVWKAAGMRLDNVEFVWCADAITSQADKYWSQCLDVARAFNITRIKKCCQIMGRLENRLTAAQILYPLMQCTDIFFLQADICQLGVDQRKVNMLAREYCDHIKRKLKPIILSHHMLYGLKKGQEKMSKSDPDSAIFMEDSEEDVRRKITAAYCPMTAEADEAPAEAQEGEPDAGLESMHLVTDELKNPCLDYVRHIVFSAPGASFEVGGKTFTSAEEVQTEFVSGALSEEALKEGLITKLNQLLHPVRQHFAEGTPARAILDKVREFSADKTPPPPRLRRMKIASLGDVPAVHAVMAPTATHAWSLPTLLSLAMQLAAAQPPAVPVLWLPNWGSFVRNALTGDEKAIHASYTALVAALGATFPDLMGRVRVLWQKETILESPGDYWISVIDVGRAFSLSDLVAVEDMEEAGQVVATLMQVADTLALAPESVGTGSSRTQLAMHGLVAEYLERCGVDDQLVEGALRQPRLISLPCPPPHVTVKGQDPVSLLVFDSAQDVQTKLKKKAFCREGEVAYNPPLAFAEAVGILHFGSLEIKRTPENGGDKTYTDVAELRRDVASAALHPNDLKPAVANCVGRFLEPVQKLLKSDKAVKDADAKLKAIAKKLAKK